MSFLSVWERVAGRRMRGQQRNVETRYLGHRWAHSRILTPLCVHASNKTENSLYSPRFYYFISIGIIRDTHTTHSYLFFKRLFIIYTNIRFLDFDFRSPFHLLWRFVLLLFDVTRLTNNSHALRCTCFFIYKFYTQQFVKLIGFKS